MYGIVDPAIKWSVPNVRYQVSGVEHVVAYETLMLKIVINQCIEGRICICKTHLCNLIERISQFPSVSFFLYFSIFLFLSICFSLSSCSPNFLSFYHSHSVSLSIFFCSMVRISNFEGYACRIKFVCLVRNINF